MCKTVAMGSTSQVPSPRGGCSWTKVARIAVIVCIAKFLSFEGRVQSRVTRIMVSSSTPFSYTFYSVPSGGIAVPAVRGRGYVSEAFCGRPLLRRCCWPLAKGASLRTNSVPPNSHISHREPTGGRTTA